MFVAGALDRAEEPGCSLLFRQVAGLHEGWEAGFGRRGSVGVKEVGVVVA